MSSKRRSTLSDVARHARVSPVTVSRAIRHPEMVSGKLKARIDNSVASLNYIPSNLASALASTRTGIVGVILPSLANGVFDGYLGAIQDVLYPAGIQVLVSNVRCSEVEEEKAISTLLGYHPEAMIVAGIDQTGRSRSMLKKSGIPIVQTMNVTDAPIDLNVGLDYVAAAAAAVRFLHERGHRTIAHLAAGADSGTRRLDAGYRRAMSELGLPTEGLIASSPRHSGIPVGGELLIALLARNPGVTAVFACDDDLALGALFECQRRGIRVPEGIAIFGFNDLDFCDASVPTLTSVAVDRREIGIWAASAVLEIIRGTGKRSGPNSVDIGFSIRSRGSTDTVRAAIASKAPRRSPRTA